MARPTLLIAFLAVLVLFVAHTSATRRQEEQDSCRKQIQKLNLKHCEKHIMKRLQREDEDEDEDVLTMRGINYIRNRESEEGSSKKKCCAQLSQVNVLDCRCQAMQEIMDRVRDRCEKREMDDAEKELWNLPLRCGIAPPIGCDLRSSDD